MRTASLFRLGIAFELASAISASARAAVSGLQLRSSAFAAGGAIPSRFRCDREDVPAPLAWASPPVGAKMIGTYERSRQEIAWKIRPITKS